MKDYYGRTFDKRNIKNKEAIGFIEPKSLDDFSAEEINNTLVLITDKNNGEKLYLLSDLKQILKANHYSRLEDPLTRLDILDQIPDFHPVIEYEQQAAHYNAWILDENPDFLPLLEIYVKEVLHKADEHAYLETDKNDIRANKSEELDRFYATIANFPQKKQEAFYSLFITNRRCFNQGQFWTFPAKWEVDLQNTMEVNTYAYVLRHRFYTPFPHRNVLIADLISDPENACLHSWGMDVLYLLLEYHIGNNRPFTLFDSTSSIIHLEQAIRARIEQSLIPGSLDSKRGYDAFKRAKNVTIISTVIKLEQACAGYMDYILAKLNVEKEEGYPSPDNLKPGSEPLIIKYKAVYEMYATLQEDNDLELDEEARLTQFKALYNEQERQETIAKHRDGVGIRFLNILSSILSGGIKNLISYYSNEGYAGFWSSRGAHLNQNIATIIDNTQQFSL